ncbi:Uncharacterised protein [Mycobacteroides abscessus subsp. abscessus]|nr:Uncharacterised protein [Mycobacteroides abscessus subsp. abscessus]
MPMNPRLPSKATNPLATVNSMPTTTNIRMTETTER